MLRSSDIDRSNLSAPGFRKLTLDLDLPQEASFQPWNLGISNFDLVPVLEQRSVLWLYGVVRYEDIYGDSHESRFCFSFVFPGGFNPNPAGFDNSGPIAYNRNT